MGSISEEKVAEALNSLDGDEEPGSNSSTVLSVKRAKGLLRVEEMASHQFLFEIDSFSRIQMPLY